MDDITTNKIDKYWTTTFVVAGLALINLSI